MIANQDGPKTKQKDPIQVLNKTFGLRVKNFWEILISRRSEPET